MFQKMGYIDSGTLVDSLSLDRGDGPSSLSLGSKDYPDLDNVLIAEPRYLGQGFHLLIFV